MKAVAICVHSPTKKANIEIKIKTQKNRNSCTYGQKAMSSALVFMHGPSLRYEKITVLLVLLQTLN